ncbi:MAG TPA: hypothetical protein VLH12_05325 [Usitatibacter sp.]|nr:hypothetical protein [Usitatibacter sp.]
MPETTVVVTWVGSMSGAHGPWYPCYHLELATTDAQGHFRVPRWKVATGSAGLPKDLGYLNTVTLDKPIQTYAFAPGHLGVEKDWRSGDTPRIEMRPFEGSPAEYFNALGGLHRNLFACATNEAVIVPLLEATYRDAERHASTPAEKAELEGLLVSVEIAKYGNDAAQERHRQRYIEQRRGKIQSEETK